MKFTFLMCRYIWSEREGKWERWEALWWDCHGKHVCMISSTTTLNFHWQRNAPTPWALHNAGPFFVLYAHLIKGQTLYFDAREATKTIILSCWTAPRKSGEPEEWGTAWHAELSSTGTVCHLQPHRYQTGVHFRNYLTLTSTHDFRSLFYFSPNMAICPPLGF